MFNTICGRISDKIAALILPRGGRLFNGMGKLPHVGTQDWGITINLSMKQELFKTIYVNHTGQKGDLAGEN